MFMKILVEMAGIEPASERFSPQTSTSVVACSSRSRLPQATKVIYRQLLGPESPSFVCLVASHTAFWLSHAQSYLRPESGVSGR